MDWKQEANARPHNGFASIPFQSRRLHLEEIGLLRDDW